MTIETINGCESAIDYVSWALEKGLWNGREIDPEGLDAFKEELIQKIALAWMSQDPESFAFREMSAELAYLGAIPDERDEIEEELKVLNTYQNGMIVSAGFFKSLKKFWQKHKVEIIVGIVAVAVVTAVAVGVICATGTATAAAAGSAMPSNRNEDKKDKAKPAAPPSPSPPDPKIPKSDPMNGDAANPSVLTPLPQIPLPSTRIGVGPDALTINGQNMGYEEALKPQSVADILRSQGYPFHSSSTYPSSIQLQNSRPLALPESYSPPPSLPQTFQIGPQFGKIPIYKSQYCPPETGVLAWMSKMIDWGNSDIGIEENPPIPQLENAHSQVFRTEGILSKGIRIFGINGINTSLGTSIQHAEHLAKLANGHSVIWVHNHSNGPPIDVAEAALVNMNGSSPNVKNLLLEQWTAFHKENLDNPNAKCIQFSHSQGAIHTLNTLMSAPEEIRNRVISVTIAPAAIIPRGLCHAAFNYASKKDAVYCAEMLSKSMTDLEEARKALDKLDGLQLVVPHSGASGLDHDFESPTFVKKLADHMKEYLELQ